ncbi:MAG: toprim domain-containing protein [Aerococcaceae bacterium]|nr:toprim domain-containing protein [Aerococcaceae bacterium]
MAVTEKPTGKRFTQQQIDLASQVSIIDYIQAKGIGTLLQPDSNYPKLRYDGHDSLIINRKQNTFYHNAYLGSNPNAHGNLINFIQYIEGVKFQEAVQMILEFAGEDYQPQQTVVEEKAFVYDYQEAKYNTTAYKYLTETRGIDKGIVRRLFDDKYIIQDRHYNVIFNWTEDGRPPNQIQDIVGATQQLTKPPKVGQSSKHIKTASKKDHGFSVRLGERVEAIYAFEAAIDLLSYWTLHKDTLNNCRLLSLEGVKPQTAYNVLSQESERGTRDVTLYLCTDNDHAGIQFLEHFFETAENSPIQIQPNIPHQNVLTPEAVAQLKEYSTTYDVPFHQAAAVYLVERPYIGNAKHQDRLFYEGIELGVARLAQQLRDTPGQEFNRLLRDLDYSAWEMKHVKRSLAEGVFVGEVVHKDWNDLLKQPVALERLHWQEQAMTTPTIESTIQSSSQRLTPESISTVSKQYGYDPEVVALFAKKGWLRQVESSEDLMFVWSKQGQAVGAETVSKEGTNQSIPGSNRQEGFIFTIGQPKSVYVVDNPQSALAFLSLHRGLKDAVVISRSPDMETPQLTAKIDAYLQRHSIERVVNCQTDGVHRAELGDALATKQVVTQTYTPQRATWLEELAGFREYQHYQQQLTQLKQQRAKPSLHLEHSATL